MVIPNFTDPDEARKYVVDKLEEILKSVENAKTHEEKVKIMKDFDMEQFKAEEQMLCNKQIKDYVEYQKAKALVYDFLNWVEDQKGINTFRVSNASPFFNEMVGEKTFMIAMLLQMLTSLPVELQAYFILNIFRTTYELNFKNMSLILHESLKKQGKKTFDFYYIDTFKKEFGDYQKINELTGYFKNDIRNPIAHEDWFVKNDWVWTKNKGIEKKQDMMEISKQIYELFYFRVALSTYLLEKYKDFAKGIQVTPQQVNDFIKGIEEKIKELKEQ